MEARLLTVAVSVKSSMFTPGGGPLSRRGRLSEQSLLLLAPVEARGVAVAVRVKKTLFLLPPVEARARPPRPSE